MKNAVELLTDLHGRGISPKPLPGGKLEFPARVLSDADRAMIRALKPDLYRLVESGALRYVAKGIPPEHVERVVKLLAERDPWDDRKSCGECASYAAGFCVKRLQPIGQCDDISLVLHRCAGYAPDLAVSEGERHE